MTVAEGAAAAPARRRWPLAVGLVLLALALALVGVGAAVTLDDGGPVDVSLDADGCLADPEGDVATPDPAPEAEELRGADLLSLCVMQGAGSVTFSADLDGAPFDLAAPSSFSEATWVTFGVDGDADGVDDRVVVVGVDELGDLSASVVDPASDDVVCDGLQLTAGPTDLEVRDVPTRCLGDPPDLRVVVVRSLDTDAGPGVATAADRLPDRGSAVGATRASER